MLVRLWHWLFSIPCPLPVASDTRLHADRVMLGISYKFHCEICGQWHRIPPENVVVERL